MKNIQNFLQQNAVDYIWEKNKFTDHLNQPLSLAYCTLVLVKQGHADLTIQFKPYHLKAGDLLILADDQLVMVQNKSPDFSCHYCAFNRNFASEVAYRLPNSLFAYLNLVPLLSPAADQLDLIQMWEDQTDFIMQSTNTYQRILLCNHLQNFFLILAEIVDRNQQLPQNEHSRKEELCWRFWEMIAKHSQTQREVAFYAQALNITPYYLSQLCRQIFNDSPKTLIDRQVILKLKGLLKTSSLSIQTIADQMNFNDTSYMCRYFKKHTGYTVRQYKKEG